MGLDLAPYDLIDDAYEESEQGTMILRMIQSADGGVVGEADLIVLTNWVLEFQKKRGLIALALRGLVRIHVVDGELGFQVNPAVPFASLEEMVEGGDELDGWLNERLDPQAFR